MKITDLLKPQSILLNADPVTKADAIYTLGELMDKGGYLTDKAEYLKAVFAREESGSTGLGDGIATPHAKSAGVKEPGLAAMVVPNGVDFEALDGQPSRLFFMIAAPEGAADTHVVRISPFDAAARRHTSFAAVDVMPEIDDTVEINIDMKDVQVDTYRASGAGGQHINKTDSAVRMTHKPTGIVVQCQTQRSQMQNREQALRLLRAKLFELELEKQAELKEQIGGTYQAIEWGSQIRSYVFHPYNLVKDHRTSVETGNVQAVMDGNLDPFIEGFLKKEANLTI